MHAVAEMWWHPFSSLVPLTTSSTVSGVQQVGLTRQLAFQAKVSEEYTSNSAGQSLAGRSMKVP